ncbi:MAG: Clostridium epsilon toxin ETX/ mosquitocidal toxin [Pseudomonadota bacterium]|jgi:hypothetical protein
MYKLTTISASLLLYSSMSFASIIPSTYLTDDTIKKNIELSTNPAEYDDICQGYSNAKYSNIVVRAYSPEFESVTNIKVITNNSQTKDLYAGKNTYYNNNDVTSNYATAPFEETFTNTSTTTTTHGWRTSAEVSGGEAGKRLLPIPGIKTNAEYSGSISHAVQQSQAEKYTAASQTGSLPPHYKVEVGTKLSTTVMNGEYSFDAILGGTALVSYTATCNGKNYDRFSQGPIAGFLYYRKPNILLPEGMTFGTNESGLTQVHITSGGTVSGQFGTDYTVIVYEMQPIDSTLSPKPSKIVKGTYTVLSPNSASAQVKPSDITTIFK